MSESVNLWSIEVLTHLKMKNKDNLKNKDKLKNEDNLKIKDYLKNENHLYNKINYWQNWWFCCVYNVKIFIFIIC